MSVELFREFTIESARQLTGLPAEHPCGRIHGHTFRISVHVNGEINSDTGWLMDFSELDDCIRAVREQIDHKLLNDIPGLENPTTEIMARWLWKRLKPDLPGLSRIMIRENPYSGCIYTEDSG